MLTRNPVFKICVTISTEIVLLSHRTNVGLSGVIHNISLIDTVSDLYVESKIHRDDHEVITICSHSLKESKL